ncbi:MAG: hypothetical protein H0X17_01365 [Deltaproteobacteria bacterium]|nr:hypothetical protein [Deltaproteobacteria bacterium]
MSRVAAAVVSIVLLGATLSPLHRKPADDGYPLSTYPMFAWKRPTQLRMSYALGVTPAGRRYIPPLLVGSFEVLEARATIDGAVSRGGRELSELCHRIAGNVRQRADFAEVTAIRIVTGTHEAIDFLVRGVIGREIERTRCEVPR